MQKPMFFLQNNWLKHNIYFNEERVPSKAYFCFEKKHQTYEFSLLVDFLRIFKKSLFSRFLENSTKCLLNILIPAKFT